MLNVKCYMSNDSLKNHYDENKSLGKVLINELLSFSLNSRET